MIGGKSVLAVIPARGGSKGVPRKNVKMLGGKPLIAWTIESAKASRLIDRLILTSEDAEIIDIARRFGCEAPFVRPAELAADETPGMAPITHALSQLPGYDYIVVLQPTSPLRTTGDIDASIEKYHRSGRADSCVTVIKSDTPQEWLFVRNDDDFIEPLKGQESDVRRQDTKEILVLNGAVYVSTSAWIEKQGSFLKGNVVCQEMPPENSLDIDTMWDWHLVECVIAGPKYVR
jgi:CMP-N,N'-diacetyllegionaminic acid synthase